MATPPRDLPPPPPGRSGWPWTGTVPPDPSPAPSRPPRITIVTPSFNQAAFIEATIRSVLLQGWPDLEYIVMDGGSTDETIAILRKYEPWLAHWESERDRGQSHAVNKGWRRATGQIIAWLNSDDLYLPGALERIAAEFTAQPDLWMLGGGCVKIDAAGRELARKPARSFDVEAMLTGSKPAQAATFFHRRVLDEVGLLREDLQYCMDREYVLRIARRAPAGAVRTISDPLACLRFWPGTKSIGGDAAAVAERRGLVEEFLRDWPGGRGKSRLRRNACRAIYANQARRERSRGRRAAELRCLALAAAWSRRGDDLARLFRRALGASGE
jgi:glycosyltransferase involved in cell wall biosynthesis